MSASASSFESLGYRCRFQREPEGGYTVTCPKLPPVVTYGETLAEARTNAREAVALVLDYYRDKGLEIPPSDRMEDGTERAALI